MLKRSVLEAVADFFELIISIMFLEKMFAEKTNR